MSELSTSQPNLKPLTAIWLVAAKTAESLMGKKKVFFLVILTTLPILVFSLIKFHGDPTREAFFTGVVSAYLQLLVPLVSLFQGSAALSDEIDDRTLTYLLLRPISRRTLLVGHVLGAWFSSALILVTSAFFAHVVTYYDGTVFGFWDTGLISRFPIFALMICVGSLFYTTAAAMLSVSVKRPIFLGLPYALVVEGVFSITPGPVSNIALSYHLARMLPLPYVTTEGMIATTLGIPVEAPRLWLVIPMLMLAFAALFTLASRCFQVYDTSAGATED